MSIPDTQPVGIALLCDLEGKILEVIRDELGLADRITPGQLVSLMVDRGSLAKALSFLAELHAKGAAFDWELNIPIDREVLTLHFAGGVIEDNILIVGAKTSNGVIKLYEELMRINNEQINALRLESQVHTKLYQAHPEKEGTLYDELSRLNNELVNLQRELAKKNAELENLNKLKNQFLSMAAHDLRSPLSIILAYSEFMLDEAVDVLDEEHVEFLHIIQSSSRFMLQLVNDLLDVSTIESGQLNLNLEPADLNALINRNTTLNRILAQKKQIELLYDCQEEIPVMTIDIAKIEQVLNNLISNAIRYSYPHSTIRIRVTRQNNEAVISVRDEGQGIPEYELDNLFNLFARTSVRGTDGEKSTGLGLAIAHRIVLGHGGKIWVESRVDEGTIFYVSLPIAPNPGQQLH